MGFSRGVTTHHFHPLKDGGEIIVANDQNGRAKYRADSHSIKLYRRPVLERQFQTLITQGILIYVDIFSDPALCRPECNREQRGLIPRYRENRGGRSSFR